MNILLIGATGGTGLAFAQTALEHGHHIKAMVRDPVQFHLRHARLQIVQGDVLREQDVAHALQDCDVVVSALGVRLGQPAGTTRSEGTKVLVKAMKKQGAKRLVAVSSIGVGSSVANQSGFSRWVLPKIIGKDRLLEVARQEEIVSSSSLNWTLVRPTRLVDGPAKGDPRVGQNLQTQFASKISREDLARFLVAEVEGDNHVGQSVTVTH